MLSLSESAETLELWPHRFRLELTVRLSAASLTMTLLASNTGQAAFDFQAEGSSCSCCCCRRSSIVVGLMVAKPRCRSTRSASYQPTYSYMHMHMRITPGAAAYLLPCRRHHGGGSAGPRWALLRGQGGRRSAQETAGTACLTLPCTCHAHAMHTPYAHAMPRTCT